MTSKCSLILGLHTEVRLSSRLQVNSPYTTVTSEYFNLHLVYNWHITISILKYLQAVVVETVPALKHSVRGQVSLTFFFLNQSEMSFDLFSHVMIEIHGLEFKLWQLALTGSVSQPVVTTTQVLVLG